MASTHQGGLTASRLQEASVVGANLGGPLQSYEIAVYTASREASDTLGKLLKEWAKKNNHPGLVVQDLPRGLQERHRIRIKRIK